MIVLLADPLSKVALALAVPWLRWLLPAGCDGVATLPLWLQIALALLSIESGKYWSHRLHHAWPLLWCLHAHHHAPERMHALNGLRFHPLNHWINQTLGVLPALLLGVSADAVLDYMALTWPIVLLQHADLRTRPRWLNGILATPAAHIWHHSASPHDGQRNFGNALLLWDRVFGTYRNAVGNVVPDELGLFPESRKHMPGNGYFQQMWWCGVWRR